MSGRQLAAVLPALDEGYRGARGARRFLIGATIVTTARSLVHMFLPDGGMTRIARVDTSGDGGKNVVAMTGQWGLEQLLLAGVSWVAVFRYPALIPFALLLHLLDLAGRIGVGRLKPLVVDRPPPGAIGQVLALPFTAAALWFSLPASNEPSAH
jgi:hypothetical protein